MIAGGYGPDKLRTDDGVLRLVRDLNEQDKSIAFIGHARWVPASAGIVGGRVVTSAPSIADDLRNAGAEWKDAEVVVDGNLVSSRGPMVARGHRDHGLSSAVSAAARSRFR